MYTFLSWKIGKDILIDNGNRVKVFSVMLYSCILDIDTCLLALQGKEEHSFSCDIHDSQFACKLPEDVIFK